MDYRDHRPDLNQRLLLLLTSGIGLRQSARVLKLSRRCCEVKFRKLAVHLRALNMNLRDLMANGSRLQLDEIETYEGRRNTRPLTVPVLIHRESRFILWAETAPIRPRGKMTERRRIAIADDEARFGRRPDLSRAALQRTLQRGAELLEDPTTAILETDEKTTYPALISSVFGNGVVHRRTNSRLARRTWNPLFPINQTEAVLRDLTGRLRRNSWLVSKQQKYLELGLQVFIAYRNYVRRRFNYDEECPAQLLGVTPRRFKVGELLSWRQDWGELSMSPIMRAAA